MAVTLKDIARDLGVSVVTVSKVLRGGGDIGEATKRKILRRAREVDYQPNLVARSLATQRTNTIGLVVPELMQSFFAEIAQGVARAVRPAGYHVLIAHTEESAEVEVAEVEALLARRVDGLLIATAQRPGATALFERITARSVPYVLVDRQLPGSQANFVGVSDEEAGRQATEHLLAGGCREIAHLAGPEITPGQGRLQGYRSALEAHGLKVRPRHVIAGCVDDQGGAEGMRKLLRTTPRPDGVFCFNDGVAAGALKVLVEAGIPVPGEIRVVGSGNVHFSDLLMVPLTTIDQNAGEIGRRAAELLLELIGAKRPRKPRQVFLPSRLVVRRSSQGMAGRVKLAGE